MLKRILSVMLMGLGTIAIILWTKDIIWPMIHTHGIIENGNYRGVEVGDDKRHVLWLQADTKSRLKIAGYKGPGGKTITVFHDGDCQKGLLDSDVWYLIYPGLHQETLEVSFDGSRVRTIEYRREVLAP